jgi:hypothetical protein
LRFKDICLPHGTTIASSQKRPVSRERSGKLDPVAVWNPALDITNVRTFRSFRYSFFAHPDGTVFWEERFDAILSNEFYLRRFPFDTESMVVRVQPLISGADLGKQDVTFADQSYSTFIDPGTYLAAWEIKGIAYSVKSTPVGNSAIVLPQARFEVIVKRRAGFCVWQVFVPILLMVAVPWSVFWISTKEFDWQMKIPVTIMLAMVAFEFAIARDLPRVGYITFLDAVFLVGFFFTFLAIAEVIVVHVLIMRWMQPLAEKVHRAPRWAFPLGYALVIAALIPIFFIGRGRPL